MNFSATLCAAILLDIIIGDPPNIPHPVVLTGRCISMWERIIYPPASGQVLSPDERKGLSLKIRGILLCCAVLLSVSAAVGAIMFAASSFSREPEVPGALCSCACVWLLYRALAWRSLKDETLSVAKALFHRDLPAARSALSRVVGRDTAHLGADAVSRAAVETIAENSVDGVLSVMFFAALGWILAGSTGTALSVWLFKASSTMDSMVGYDNERYHDFGWAAAKLDDALNFIPARLGGIVIIAAGGLAQAGFYNVENPVIRAVKVFFRDRKKHASPNSAHPESAFAGLLGLRLGGGAHYGGVFEPRPFIGTDARINGPAANAEDILSAHSILDASSALFALLMIIFVYILK